MSKLGAKVRCKSLKELYDKCITRNYKENRGCPSYAVMSYEWWEIQAVCLLARWKCAIDIVAYAN